MYYSFSEIGAIFQTKPPPLGITSAFDLFFSYGVLVYFIIREMRVVIERTLIFK
jgi:hypothetical protein